MTNIEYFTLESKARFINALFSSMYSFFQESINANLTFAVCRKRDSQLETLRIAFTANVRFAFMFSRKHEYMDENSAKIILPFIWCQRKTTQICLENETSEPQMWDKHGHLVIAAVCIILNRQIKNYAYGKRQK